MRIIPISLFSVAVAFSAVNQDGLNGVDQIFSAKSSGHMRMGLSLGAAVSNDETELGKSRITEGNTSHTIDSYISTSAQLAMGLGFGNYSELSLAIPGYYERLHGSGGFERDQGGTGDVNFRIKAELPIRDQKIFHIAVLLGVTAPTAMENGTLPRKLELHTHSPTDFNLGSSPYGTGRIGTLGALGVTFDFSNLEPSKTEIRWHLNGGARKPSLVADPPFDDILFGGTAVEWGLNPFLLLSTEFYHESRFNHLNKDDWFDTELSTLTLQAAARFGRGFQIHAGAILGLGGRIPDSIVFQEEDKTGLTRFTQTASSQVALYARIEWSGQLVSLDKDNDGIAGQLDQCPYIAEDLDGFQDQDGCPDLDNDQDGIPDTKDKCSNKPEDKDGFQDEDGCPDPDNDQDGIPDLKDQCPNDAQGAGGTKGCPNLDTDNDGVPNGPDKCATEKEDRDGFEDEDGCPEPDNDKDGLCDPWVAEKGLAAKYVTVCKGSDKCIGAPETMNKFEDQDGCPDSVSVQVQVKEVVKEIVKTLILKGVNFRTGSAELTTESYSVLNEVVTQLQGSPETEFEVSGHTDDKGNPVKNQMLSQARAQTVADYFIQKGVGSKRLKVMGYGSAKPISSNRTGEGRAMNRRVELNRTK